MISFRSEKRAAGFKFRFFVILVKYSFIVLSNKGSSERSLPFSINISLFDFRPLLLKKGLIEYLKLYPLGKNSDRKKREVMLLVKNASLELHFVKQNNSLQLNPNSKYLCY